MYIISFSILHTLVTGLISVTAIVASNLGHWINLSLRISPLMAIIVVMFSVFIIGQLWKRYSSDVNSTLLRIVLRSAYYAQFINFDFLYFADSFDNETQSNSKMLNRRRLQMLVMFLMAQICYEPSRTLTWLFSMLCYTFTEEMVLTIFKDCTSANYQTFNLRLLLQDRALTYRIVLKLSKAYVSLFLMWYQISFIDTRYMAVTLSFYILSQGFFEKELTNFIERFQFEFFEGLEQHYIVGLFSVCRIIYSLAFMLAVLMEKRQMLMLFALYTNVYTGCRELMTHCVAIAITEWISIAKFARATREELVDNDDICPVCLSTMRSARKTTCGHFFHGHCLRRCLKQKKCCPLCLQSLPF